MCGTFKAPLWWEGATRGHSPKVLRVGKSRPGFLSAPRTPAPELSRQLAQTADSRVIPDSVSGPRDLHLTDSPGEADKHQNQNLLLVPVSKSLRIASLSFPLQPHGCLLSE